MEIAVEEIMTIAPYVSALEPLNHLAIQQLSIQHLAIQQLVINN